jgi:O-antigen/teichoic acid export membrane protein
MNITLSVERIKHWGLQGGMAILDQGLFSGSNFILNILLARWLLPEDYGAYAIGFAVSIFFLQLLMSYILEPMGVLGTSSYSSQLKDYLVAQLHLYFGIIAPLSLLFTLAVYVYRQLGGNLLVSDILIVMGLLLSFTLLPWLLRRVFYILGQPDVSAKGSAIYAFLLIAFVYFAKQLEILTPFSALAILAFSSLIAGAFLSKELGWNVIGKAIVPLRSVFFENWAFGKWLLASGLLITIGGQAQIFLAGLLLNVKDAGIVKATHSISNPMILSITAISALVTPILASDYAKADIISFKHKAFLMTVIMTVLAFFFELLLFFFRTQLESILYGGKFSAYAGLIPIWGLIPLIMGMVSGMQYSLQAAKRPYAILVASFFWVPATLGLGIVMIGYWGLWGVAISTVIGYVVLGSALSILYWKWIVRSNLR